MTTKEFLESYGGKLFSKRIKHLDDMEGFKNVGYIPTKGSGITIGYGIDLGFQTVETLVKYGIDRKTAEMWDEKGYLGKLYTDFEIEGKNPKSEALKVSIDKGIKNKLAQNIFIKADKALEKYQGKVSDDVYASLTTLYNFSGGFGKEQKEGFKTPGALKRKSHAVSTVFKSIDKWVKDNPDELVPDRLVNESLRYSQISLAEGAKLIGADSDSNATTLGREANYIEAKSENIIEEKLAESNQRHDKGKNKIEKEEKPDYSDYYVDYRKDFNVKDPLENVEVDDIEDEEFVPERTISLDSKNKNKEVLKHFKDKVETSTPSVIDTRGKSQAAVDAIDAESEDVLYEESFLDKVGGLSSLIGLASGAVGLGAALKDVDIPKDPKLGPAFQQRLEESKRLAQQGLTPSELAKAHNDLDSSYATGIENIVRGSAGNRAQFLAGLGGLDVARQSALMDIAVADAQMQRQNQQKYDSMMIMDEQYNAARESKYQNAKYQQAQASKQSGAQLAAAGISMVADAVGSRQVDRYNKIKNEKMLMDMGYKTDKFGRSGQDQVGVDPTTGEKAIAFLSRAKDKIKDKALNLLSADDAPVKVELEEQEGILGNNKKKSGLIDPTFNPGNEMFGYK